MITTILSSIGLVIALVFTNRLRGSGPENSKIIAKSPIGAKHLAGILFGVAVSLYFFANGIIPVNSVSAILFHGFDPIIFLASALGFIIWSTLGWGDYTDLGTWQRDHPDGKEVGFIDAILNFLAKKFPNVFISRKEHSPTEWDTRHLRTDFVGLTLRLWIMSLFLFGFYGWYLGNLYILLVSLMLSIPGAGAYLFASKYHDNYKTNPHWWELAEYIIGGLWGISIVIIMLMI